MDTQQALAPADTPFKDKPPATTTTWHQCDRQRSNDRNKRLENLLAKQAGVSCNVTPGDGSGGSLTFIAVGKEIFISPDINWGLRQTRVTAAETPFITSTLQGTAVHRDIEKDRPVGNGWSGRWEKVTEMDTYDDPTDPNRGHHGIRRHNRRTCRQMPYLYTKVVHTAPDGTAHDTEVKFRMPLTGTATVDGTGRTYTCDAEFHGHKHTWAGTLDRNTLQRHLKDSVLPQGYKAWWAAYLPEAPLLDNKGLAAAMKQESKQDFWNAFKGDKLAWRFFCYLTEGKTREKTTNNRLLKAGIEAFGWTAKGATEYAADLHKVMDAPPSFGYHYGYSGNDTPGSAHDDTRPLCLALQGAAAAVEEAEAKHDHRKAKTADKAAAVLGITPEQYPKLHKSICAGRWPTSVFNNPDGQLVNREFPIIEKALGQKGWADPLCAIATSAGRRGTYEKDLTPYLNFLLNSLPAYLQRCTPRGKKWRCMPKFVESQWELEMDDDAKVGTSKKRSAFTPTADNATRVVTVPYVAVCVAGVRTQWCYSRFYHVFEKGMTDPISGGIVINDYEAGLNGRDDYGLMYYTLTGTHTARGYPTFLIIFERLASKGKTLVHFHRCHPKRKDKGQYRPACQLVEATYQYMAGNIPAGDITAQQGDMIYIEHPNDPVAAGAKVASPQSGPVLDFESHNHVPKVAGEQLALYLSKAETPKNRLGFIKVPKGGMAINHPEHDDVEHISEGWFEVRRARSYENNPVAIWSYTVD